MSEVHRQHHVLGDRQGRQQLKELENDADGTSAPRRKRALGECVQRMAIHHDFATARSVDAREKIEQCRFPTAGLADDGDEFASLYG